MNIGSARPVSGILPGSLNLRLRPGALQPQILGLKPGLLRFRLRSHVASSKKLDANNEKRSQNLVCLSKGLEHLGVHTFLAPSHVKRVYFEYLVRPDCERFGLSSAQLIEALNAEGCQVSLPRYPLLHQQPFFVEKAYLDVMRPSPGVPVPDYAAVSLPFTEKVNAGMLKLPSFPWAEKGIA